MKKKYKNSFLFLILLIVVICIPNTNDKNISTDQTPTNKAKSGSVKDTINNENLNFKLNIEQFNKVTEGLNDTNLEEVKAVSATNYFQLKKLQLLNNNELIEESKKTEEERQKEAKVKITNALLKILEAKK